jgi:hypothetical protein
MTTIEKPTRRKTRHPFAHYGRKIVVSLEPTDILAMRLERTRTTYRASLDDVFRILAQWHANTERKRKAAERKARKASR